MATGAATPGGKAGRLCQPKGLPFPGAAWDADGCLPGALVPAVEADPLRGERCPYCCRAYSEPGKSNWNHEIHESHEVKVIWYSRGAHRAGDFCPSRKPFILRVFGVFRGLNCRWVPVADGHKLGLKNILVAVRHRA